jgi:hypothetical protein
MSQQIILTNVTKHVSDLNNPVQTKKTDKILINYTKFLTQVRNECSRVADKTTTTTTTTTMMMMMMMMMISADSVTYCISKRRNPKNIQYFTKVLRIGPFIYVHWRAKANCYRYKFLCMRSCKPHIILKQYFRVTYSSRLKTLCIYL